MKQEWTAEGRAFHAELELAPYAVRNAFGVALKKLRHELGFPFWETKKALLNARGDVDVAAKQLMRGA